MKYKNLRFHLLKTIGEPIIIPTNSMKKMIDGIILLIIFLLIKKFIQKLNKTDVSTSLFHVDKDLVVYLLHVVDVYLFREENLTRIIG